MMMDVDGAGSHYGSRPPMVFVRKRGVGAGFKPAPTKDT
jgi:hypothetical protein